MQKPTGPVFEHWGQGFLSWTLPVPLVLPQLQCQSLVCQLLMPFLPLKNIQPQCENKWILSQF